MKLLLQPDDGISVVVDAIAKAKKSIDIMIFRCDHKDIEKALVDAVERHVCVRALIAFTNRGGETRLRGLETKLLAAGAMVARTNNDLTRYHAKYFIIDRQQLFVLGFNFTRSDTERTRSFGLVSKDSDLVEEAVRLFEADSTRQPFVPKSEQFMVSPLNSRNGLRKWLETAKKEVLIYDPEVSDGEMQRVLHDLQNDGVQVRVIGNVKQKTKDIDVRHMHPLRLHARAIIIDRKQGFLGSQSLRKAELDNRREVGLIFKDSAIAGKIASVFDEDWESGQSVILPAERLAKKVAKVVTRDLGPLAPVIEEIASETGEKIEVDQEALEQTVKEAVKIAVREVVHDAVQK